MKEQDSPLQGSGSLHVGRYYCHEQPMHSNFNTISFLFNYLLLLLLLMINRQFYLRKLLKSYLQLIRLKKRKNYSFKNTIYNFCRLLLLLLLSLLLLSPLLLLFIFPITVSIFF